ncbi:MAG TPA: AI-2E family transporter [Deinococcales bacterium]|nr:AI-2E family transporter [Deinococcales bacterium]
MNAFAYVWRSPWVRVVVYLLIAWFLYRLAGRLTGVITLAVLGYLFAYLFNPLVELSTRRRIPRALAVVLVFVLVALFLVLASVLIASIITQLIEFGRQLPQLARSLQATLDDAVGRLQQYRDVPGLENLSTNAAATVQTALADITARLLGFLQSSGLDIVSGTVGVVGNVLQFFLVFILGFYMLLSYRQIGRSVIAAFPERWQPVVRDLSHDISTAAGGYLRGQIIIAAAVGTMVAIGLTIIDVRLALALGFIAGIFNIVPYLGAIISILPAMLLAIEGGLVKVILVAVVFAVANQVEANVLSPLILSRSTNLHPVTVLIAILTGAALYGIVGALLAVPLAALAKLLVEKYWLRSRPYREA